MVLPLLLCFFFFNDPATPEIYPFSLHDALPIYRGGERAAHRRDRGRVHLPRARLPHDFRGGVPDLQEAFHVDVGLHRRGQVRRLRQDAEDRKTTLLTSSHHSIPNPASSFKKKIT